jgi:Flp pilus assembly protein TadG
MDKIDHKSMSKGQSLVELALSFTLLLLLLGGAVDLGRAFFGFVAVRDAAQEGATFASLKPIVITNTSTTIDSDKDGVQDAGDVDAELDYRIRNSSQQPLDLRNAQDIVISVENNCPNTVKVTVTYHFRSIMPLMSTIFGSGDYFPIRAEVTQTILSNKCS